MLFLAYLCPLFCTISSRYEPAYKHTSKKEHKIKRLIYRHYLQNVQT